jgi:hypothetical protein
MIVLTATCKNGAIALNHPLPNELEGKEVRILVEEIDEQSESDRDLVLGASRLSEAVFARVWDNDEDAEYDNL